MDNKELTNYIKENIQKGHSLEEIRDFLIKNGWSQKDIDNGILLSSNSKRIEVSKNDDLKPPMPPSVTQQGNSGNNGPKKKGGHKKVIIALAILIILFLALLYVAADIVQTFEDMFPQTALPFNSSALFG